MTLHSLQRARELASGFAAVPDLTRFQHTFKELLSGSGEGGVSAPSGLLGTKAAWGKRGA